MTFARKRPAWIEDLALGLALMVVIVLRPGGALWAPLVVAIVTVLLWGYVTLHVPDRVDLTEDGIVLSRYGRAHAFAFKDVDRLALRRFVLADRVLLRLGPTTPWRGRYWLTADLTGYETLVRALETLRRSGP